MSDLQQGGPVHGPQPTLPGERTLCFPRDFDALLNAMKRLRQERDHRQPYPTADAYAHASMPVEAPEEEMSMNTECASCSQPIPVGEDAYVQEFDRIDVIGAKTQFSVEERIVCVPCGER